MIQLQRTIEVRTFDVEGTVAVSRDRPEFLAVARLAADLGRPIGGTDVSRELLGRLPAQTGWLVIERCVALGLLERRESRGPARLSESGATALQHGSVLVPEEGLWRFYRVNDPLLSPSLVAVDRIESEPAKEERKEIYGRQREGKARLDRGDRVPEILVEAQNTVCTSIQNSQLFEVLELGGSGLEGPGFELHLQLRWERGGDPTVSLSGGLPQADRKGRPRRVDTVVRTPDPLDRMEYGQLWTALVASATDVSEAELGEWVFRTGAPVLPTSMDRWPDSERRLFQTDLAIPPASLGELGHFESTKLDAVPLVPRTDHDAQVWAEWLQWDQLKEYSTPTMLRESDAAILRRFPMHEPRLPSPEELLRRAVHDPFDDRARFLLAPADLGLWR